MKKALCNKTTFSLLILGQLFFLTNCHVWCSACSSEILNETTKDIYIILKSDTANFKIQTIGRFAQASKIKSYQTDTIKNTCVVIIPPKGSLKTYDGPGDNPARLLSGLKIITDKEIIEYKTQTEIIDAFDNHGALNTMTIK